MVMPQALSPALVPGLLYRSAHQTQRDLSTYELRALVCYYGSHYACFVRTDEPDAHALYASRHGRRCCCAPVRFLRFSC